MISFLFYFVCMLLLDKIFLYPFVSTSRSPQLALWCLGGAFFAGIGLSVALSFSKSNIRNRLALAFVGLWLILAVGIHLLH